MISAAVVQKRPASASIKGAAGSRGTNGAAGQNVDSIGLLTAAAGMDTAGADLVRTTGNVDIGFGAESYVKDSTADLATYPKAGFTNNVGQKYRILAEQKLTPQPFYVATDPDMQNAIQRMLDYGVSRSVGAGGAGAYKAALTFSFPPKAGASEDKYIVHDEFQIRVSTTIEGLGGQTGPDAFGATTFQVPDDKALFIPQFPGTTGPDNLGGGGLGAHNVALRRFMVVGPKTGTIGDVPAFPCRCPTVAEDIYGRGLKGGLFRVWTGVVNGHSYGGDCSTSRFVDVKGEACRYTLDIRGTDSNVISSKNCQGYQNLQYGLFDANAAGSNQHSGWHATYNGIPAPTAGPFTQCSHSGNIYTPRLTVTFLGLSDAAIATLLAANAPSGTTAPNAYWVYCYAGGPTSNKPAWSGGGPFIYGGDYLIATPYPTVIDSCYMEGGGAMSQAAQNQTEWRGGTLDRTQVYGGTMKVVSDTGYEIVRRGLMEFILRSDGGNFVISARDFADTVVGYLNWVQGGATALSAGTELDVFTAGVLRSTFAYYGLAFAGTGQALYNNGNKVVGERLTALPADATDLATVLTLANAIKARLKATGGHGLVAD